MKWRACLPALAILLLIPTVGLADGDPSECQFYIVLYERCNRTLFDENGGFLSEDEAYHSCLDGNINLRCADQCWTGSLNQKCRELVDCIEDVCDIEVSGDDDYTYGCSAFGGSPALPLTVLMLLIGFTLFRMSRKEPG